MVEICYSYYAFSKIPSVNVNVLPIKCHRERFLAHNDVAQNLVLATIKSYFDILEFMQKVVSLLMKFHCLRGKGFSFISCKTCHIYIKQGLLLCKGQYNKRTAAHHINQFL